MVHQHGWGVVGILDEEDEPTWTFSYGLWHSFRQPEIAMFGLGREDMTIWLNEIGNRVRGGAVLRAGTELTGVLGEFPVLPRAAHDSWNDGLFGTPPSASTAATHHRSCRWSGRTGTATGPGSRRPEAGERCRDWQPQLWLPVAEHPAELWPRIAQHD